MELEILLEFLNLDSFFSDFVKWLVLILWFNDDLYFWDLIIECLEKVILFILIFCLVLIWYYDYVIKNELKFFVVSEEYC